MEGSRLQRAQSKTKNVPPSSHKLSGLSCLCSGCAWCSEMSGGRLPCVLYILGLRSLRSWRADDTSIVGWGWFCAPALAADVRRLAPAASAMHTAAVLVSRTLWVDAWW